jgi:AraC family transcriptional regulator
MTSHLDRAISVAMLAKQCGLSTSYFAHAFKRTFDKSPYQYLIEQRLSRAKALMLTTELPLAQVALMSGFGSQSHFNRRFRKAFGEPPGTWRRARL